MHRVVRFLLDLPARIAIGNCRSRRSTQFDFDIRAQTSDISNATGTCRTNWSDHIPTTPIAQRFDDATFHNDRPEHKKTKKIMGHEPNKVKIKTACVSREHNGGRTIRRKKCLPSTILQHTAFRGHDHSKIISGKLVHHLPPRGRMVGVTFYNNKKEIKIVRTEEGGWEVGGRGCWVNNICYERAQLTHDRKKKCLRPIDGTPTQYCLLPDHAIVLQRMGRISPTRPREKLQKKTARQISKDAALKRWYLPTMKNARRQREESDRQCH